MWRDNTCECGVSMNRYFGRVVQIRTYGFVDKLILYLKCSANFCCCVLIPIVFSSALLWFLFLKKYGARLVGKLRIVTRHGACFVGVGWVMNQHSQSWLTLPLSLSICLPLPLTSVFLSAPLSLYLFVFVCFSHTCLHTVLLSNYTYSPFFKNMPFVKQSFAKMSTSDLKTSNYFLVAIRLLFDFSFYF